MEDLEALIIFCAKKDQARIRRAVERVRGKTRFDLQVVVGVGEEDGAW